jgi:hypothetical protein
MSDPMLGILRGQIDLERRIGQTEVRETPLSGVYASYRTAASQSIANNPIPPVIVDFGTVDEDPLGMITTGASWRCTAQFAGRYVANAAILYNSSTGWADTEAGYIALYKNGSLYRYLQRRDSYGSASGVFMMLSGMTTVALVAGDYIDVRAFQNTGAALTLLNDATFNYIDIWML